MENKTVNNETFLIPHPSVIIIHTMLMYPDIVALKFNMHELNALLHSQQSCSLLY